VPREGPPLAEAGGEPATIVVGAERDGLPSAVVAACDEVAHIPIASESLNAAMAATVALYERNRRMAAP
jgi:RNA methyltransferase, TrmH family